jgi:hypothetical protein
MDTVSSFLRDLARGKQKVIILFDEISKPTPTSRIISFVLEELRSGGVIDDPTEGKVIINPQYSVAGDFTPEGIAGQPGSQRPDHGSLSGNRIEIARSGGRGSR